jgi:phosphoglycerate dehydrogenase-like enzyme
MNATDRRWKVLVTARSFGSASPEAALLLPHLAAQTQEAIAFTSAMAARNAVDYLRTGSCANLLR